MAFFMELNDCFHCIIVYNFSLFLIMAILKFRIYWEEDDAIYRDVLVKHTQSFVDLHQIILKAFEFDQKHDATFFRSNDKWQRGREISKEVYEKVLQNTKAKVIAMQVLGGGEITYKLAYKVSYYQPINPIFLDFLF